MLPDGRAMLTPTIRGRAVQFSVDADTARRAGGETARHSLRFLDCQFTRVLAAYYSMILVHSSFPFRFWISPPYCIRFAASQTCRPSRSLIIGSPVLAIYALQSATGQSPFGWVGVGAVQPGKVGTPWLPATSSVSSIVSSRAFWRLNTLVS